MEMKRKPFQGVFNIIRFNWHFYLLSTVLLLALLLLSGFLNSMFQPYLYILIALILLTTGISLFVSFYIYDLSGLYKLNWLNGYLEPENSKIVNINAGFDETSGLLRNKFKKAEIIVLDFYDPNKHTEVSIKRARKAYPPYPGTQAVKSVHLPLANNSIDKSFALLSAHEIREENERVAFFKELNRIAKPGGQIFITEHLRDFNNFLAYNFGIFHFHPRSTWIRTFNQAGFKLRKEVKSTPFITTFILESNGDTL